MTDQLLVFLAAITTTGRPCFSMTAGHTRFIDQSAELMLGLAGTHGFRVAPPD